MLYEAGNPFFGFRSKGLRSDAVALAIARKNPHIAAFSCVTDNYQFQLSVAKALKKMAPEVKILFGGIHATAVPERILRNDEIDGVAIGEAEISLMRLLERGSRTKGFEWPDEPISGVVFKNKEDLIGEIKEGPLVDDFDTLPFPAKPLLLNELGDQPFGYFMMSWALPMVAPVA